MFIPAQKFPSVSKLLYTTAYTPLVKSILSRLSCTSLSPIAPSILVSDNYILLVVTTEHFRIKLNVPLSHTLFCIRKLCNICIHNLIVSQYYLCHPHLWSGLLNHLKLSCLYCALIISLHLPASIPFFSGLLLQHCYFLIPLQSWMLASFIPLPGTHFFHIFKSFFNWYPIFSNHPD